MKLIMLAWSDQSRGFEFQDGESYLRPGAAAIFR